MTESSLYDLEFLLGFHNLVDAYHINELDYCEVISLKVRLEKHLERREKQSNGRG